MKHDQKHPFDLPHHDPGLMKAITSARYRDYGPRVFSASSLSTFLDCPRKWYFEKVARLPRPDSPAARFGRALHGVLERWLSVDDGGRDERDLDALMYPLGWGDSISEREQQQIRSLVRRSVAEGVVTRQPERMVEAVFWWAGDPDAHTLVHGVADLVLPRTRTLEDHKTSKSTRYLKTPKTLGKDTQALVYAEMMRIMLDGEGPPSGDPRDQDPDSIITLTHNQFVTDPSKPLIRKTSCVVHPLTVHAHWNSTVRSAAEQIDDLAGSHTYKDVPETRDTKVCQKYGGCPFLRICFGDQNEDTYKEAFLRREQEATRQRTPNPTRRDPTMSTALDRLKALKERKTAPPAEPPKQKEKPAKEKKPAAKKKKKERKAPGSGEPFTKPAVPWADVRCTGCHRDEVPIAGMKKDLSGPCAVCRVRKKNKTPDDRDFQIEVTDDGVSWKVRESVRARVIDEYGEDACEGSVSVGEPKVQEKDDIEVPVEEQPSEEQIQKTVKAVVLDEPDPVVLDLNKKDDDDEDAVVVQEDAPDIPDARQMATDLDVSDLLISRTVAEASKGRGRRPTTFTLYLGAIPVEGVSKVVGVVRILDRLGAEIAKAAGTESFFECPPEQRRDPLRTATLGLIDTLKGTHVVVSEADLSSQDIAAITEVLKAHASTIVQPYL